MSRPDYYDKTKCPHCGELALSSVRHGDQNMRADIPVRSIDHMPMSISIGGPVLMAVPKTCLACGYIAWFSKIVLDELGQRWK